MLHKQLQDEAISTPRTRVACSLRHGEKPEKKENTNISNEKESGFKHAGNLIYAGSKMVVWPLGLGQVTDNLDQLSRVSLIPLGVPSQTGGALNTIGQFENAHVVTIRYVKPGPFKNK